MKYREGVSVANDFWSILNSLKILLCYLFNDTRCLIVGWIEVEDSSRRKSNSFKFWAFYAMYNSALMIIKKNNYSSIRRKCICCIKQPFFFENTICRKNSDTARVWLKTNEQENIHFSESECIPLPVSFWSAATLPFWQVKECFGHHTKASVAASGLKQTFLIFDRWLMHGHYY